MREWTFGIPQRHANFVELFALAGVYSIDGVRFSATKGGSPGRGRLQVACVEPGGLAPCFLSVFVSCYLLYTVTDEVGRGCLASLAWWTRLAVPPVVQPNPGTRMIHHGLLHDMSMLDAPLYGR